jgi:TolB protein
MKYLNLTTSILIGTLIATSNVYADQNIEIVGGNSAGRTKVAVFNFTNEDGSISDEIMSDLMVTGEFNAVKYPAAESINTQADYIISGSIESDPTSGQMQLSFKLEEALTHKVRLSQTASFNKQNLRKAVHTIDNNIYKNITTTPGAFTSKLALAVRNGKNYSLVISDYDGYNPKTILTTRHPLTSIAWDTTGNNISYVSYELGKPVVYVQNIKDGSRYILANYNGSNSSPAFVPGKSKLAVTLSKDYGSHIYLVNNQRYTSASSAIPLINFGGSIDTEADISKAGKVIFTSDHDGGPQIFMSDLNGSAPVRITKGLGNYNTTARFSNDGSKITFINRNNGVLQAYVQDLVTNSAYPISPNGHKDISPSFAPNDKLVVFSSDNSVYISNVTGTSLTRINNLNYDQIVDQRWSHNG